jgi:hypothetical protein
MSISVPQGFAGFQGEVYAFLGLWFAAEGWGFRRWPGARRTRSGKATAGNGKAIGKVVLMRALLRGKDLGAIHPVETIEGYGDAQCMVKGVGI